jgi:hypothetical protein
MDPVQILAEGLTFAPKSSDADDADRSDARGLLKALHEDGWRLVRIHDSWPADNGGHCILADEVWRP